MIKCYDKKYEKRPSRNPAGSFLLLGMTLAGLIPLVSCTQHHFVRIPPQGGTLLILTHARYLLPDCQGISTPQILWIRSGRIERITTPGEETPLAYTRVITLPEGSVVIPGIMDLHTHIGSSEHPPWVLGLPSPQKNLERFLYAGITTILDLGASETLLRELREKLEQGEISGPDLFYSGPHLGPRGGHPAAMVRYLLPWPLYLPVQRWFSFQVESLEDVDSALGILKEAGARWVKIPLDDIPLGAPKHKEPMVRALVERAHAMGFRVAIHIGTNEDLRVALASGADLLAHNVYREPLDPELARTVAARGVPVIPTIGIFSLMAELSRGRVPDLPLVRELIPERLWQKIRHPEKPVRIPEMESWFALVQKNEAQLYRNAKLLEEMGATLVLGSDSPFAAWPAGVATHAELDHLARAGISLPALACMATRNPARVLGLEDRGVIAPGKRADLVVLQGNPLQDPSFYHRILYVLKEGEIVERSPL